MLIQVKDPAVQRQNGLISYQGVFTDQRQKDLLLKSLMRSIGNHRFEESNEGIYFPSEKLSLCGEYEHFAPDGLGWLKDKNLLPTEGLNHILETEFRAGTPVTTWYMAIASGNVTVLSTWTAANFAANATELTTQYSESTRVAYTPAAASSGSINSSAAKSVFTAATTSVSVWIAALLSLSTKGGTTGTLASAAKFSAVRTLPAVSDQLSIGYTLTMTST